MLSQINMRFVGKSVHRGTLGWQSASTTSSSMLSIYGSRWGFNHHPLFINYLHWDQDEAYRWMSYHALLATLESTWHLETMMVSFFKLHGHPWIFGVGLVKSTPFPSQSQRSWCQLLLHYSFMLVTLGRDLPLIPYDASRFHASGVFISFVSRLPDTWDCKMALFRSTVKISLNLKATIASSKTPFISRSIGIYPSLWPLFRYDHELWSWTQFLGASWFRTLQTCTVLHAKTYDSQSHNFLDLVPRFPIDWTVQIHLMLHEVYFYFLPKLPRVTSVNHRIDCHLSP